MALILEKVCQIQMINMICHFTGKKGDFKIDKNKLERKISSKIFYGNIKDSIDFFIKENPKNIISIFLIWIFTAQQKIF